MSKISAITTALAAVMIVLAAVGSLCGQAVHIAHDPAFYSDASIAAVADTLGVTATAGQTLKVEAYIGMTHEEQNAFAAEITSFMKSETDAQPDVLNEKEQQHMQDVRGLVLLAQKASQLCTMLAAALAVVVAWTSAGKKKPVLLGTFIGLGVLIFTALGVALALRSGGFAPLFVRFHEIFFTNDLWLLNPETDILIRMMPQLLFERAAMDVLTKGTAAFAVTGAMLAVVYAVFGGMIRRHLTERK